MRTEQLLRQTLDELADTAPHPTRISLERPVRRRPTRTLLLAAAVALVVLAVLVPLAVTRTTAEPADRRAPGYWRMISRVEPPAGWQVTQRGIVDGRELIELSRGDRPCQLTTYGRSRIPADLLAGGESVTVAGRPGTWVPAVVPQPSRLVWAYDDDAYAMVSCDGDTTEADQLALADTARFDQITDLRLPFRLTDLPAGYQIQSVLEITGPDGFDAGVQSTADDRLRPGFDISVRRQPFDPPGAHLPGVTTTTVRGYPAEVRDDELGVQLTVGDHYPTVTSTDGGAMRGSLSPGDRDLLVQVAGDLRFASDLTDPGTWFTAARAVP